jgi:hypothetical protein
MMNYGFTLSGVTLPAADDLFGVWRIPDETSLAFDTSAPGDPIWRVSLPASIDEARSILHDQWQAIQLNELALTQAGQRLARLGQSRDSVSFSALTGPEAELFVALNRLESVSFGLGGEEAAGQLEASSQWRKFLDQVRNVIAHYAQVETIVGGSFIGRTSVGWTGDFNTRWSPAATSANLNLHHQSVHLALASRLALVRMIGVVGTGAINITIKLATPGAQLLALPAIWKFVRDVLKERKSVNQLTS